MAKRRNKNKVKRRLAGAGRKKNFGYTQSNVKVLMDNTDLYNAQEVCKVTDEEENRETVTENEIVSKEFTETVKNKKELAENQQMNKMKKKLNILGNNMEDKIGRSDESTEETLIFPREIDGETCLDIECGSNEAVLFLSKLCLGSKGSCIKFLDKWLTPNEFQSISGRETAKDWKRSIRHNAKSLKILITKGLININSSSPGKKGTKKTNGKPVVTKISVKPVTGKSPEENMADDPSHPTTQADDKQTFSPTRNEVENDETACGNVLPVDPTESDNKNADNGDSSAPIHSPGNSQVTIPMSGSLLTEPLKKKRGRKPKKMRQRNQMLIARAARKHSLVPKALSPITKSFEAPQTMTIEQAEEAVDPTIPEPEVKLPAQENKEISEIKPEEKDAVHDTRTDEERRLDEFVKSLRLTKATAGTKSQKAAPELPAIDITADKERVHDDNEEVEMPVLEKVSDIPQLITTFATEGSEASMVSTVDGFHATVTPPPTPPSEKVAITQKLDNEEKVVDTFKSHLSSNGCGLKLTINREKVKVAKPKTETDVKPPQPQKEQNIQTLLLQDALQSAKKYKEKLQQTRQHCQSQPIIQVPKVPTVKAFDRESDKHVPHLADKPALETNRAMQYKYLQEAKHQLQMKCDRTPRLYKPDRQIDVKPRSKHSTNIPVSHHKHKPSFPNVNGTSAPSMNDVMAMMTNMYGSQPIPADKKEAVFTALQELHQKNDMLRYMTPGAGVPGAEGSPLLYPMLTQQLLLAMTQQLYTMCKVPGANQSQVEPKKVSSKPTTHEHRPVSGNSHSPSKPFDLSQKKRKLATVDANGALDLSMKRPKLDGDNIQQTKSVQRHDIPIDFSVKSSPRTGYPCDLPANFSRKSFPTTSVPNIYSRSSPLENKHFQNYGNWNGGTNGFAKTVPPSICTCGGKGLVDDITTWSVGQVCSFVRNLEGCAHYAKTFQDQGISGRLLPYLSTQHLTRTLGMKVGPALTLINAVERKCRERQLTSSSCALCTRQRATAVPM